MTISSNQGGYRGYQTSSFYGKNYRNHHLHPEYINHGISYHMIIDAIKKESTLAGIDKNIWDAFIKDYGNSRPDCYCLNSKVLSL